MKEGTRRQLLTRLKFIAAASAIGYVAPKAVLVKTALATHKASHTPGPPCSSPPCNP